MVFYADNTRQVVSTVNMSSGEEVLFRSYGPETVYGLAVNWVDRTLLYATNSTIAEVDIDTGLSIANTTISRARHLVIHANAEQRCITFVCFMAIICCTYVHTVIS